MTRVASVDIGTNSVRLLVADLGTDGGPKDVSLQPVERLMRITRLGQGVDSSRRLHPDAIARTTAVLREYGEVIRTLGAERVRATATSAARDSANRDEFFDAAEAALGQRPELLSGDDEAALSFLGATADLREGGPFLVVDIGGGSTEFVSGTEKPEGAVSVDIGCVRLTEQFLHSDPPAPEELSQAVSVVRDHLADVDREVRGAASARTLVGLAGTVTTMAAVELGLAEYNRDAIHHFRLTRVAAEDVFRTLATEPSEVRRHNPGLEEGRVDVIVGGALIAVSIMRHWSFDEMLVSESDILDGLARSLR
ncbi:MAG: Ppx/GppA phosphatase family [Actinomycetia bacterium]|nr:Ppx/GppA phosphatase family [Actinomycetes bacterium]